MPGATGARSSSATSACRRTAAVSGSEPDERNLATVVKRHRYTRNGAKNLTVERVWAVHRPRHSVRAAAVIGVRGQPPTLAAIHNARTQGPEPPRGHAAGGDRTSDGG